MGKYLTRVALAVAFLLPFFLLAAPAPKAAALSGSEFNPSRIIDDGVFYDASALTVGQIQEFLNAKVPTCDTWGTQPRGNTTRAAYGTSVGNPPPYTCLKDFRQGSINKSYEAGLCNGYTGKNESAAEIIYNVSQSCGVSPKVLLVLLQKEQSLITDDWPWPIQYRAATGYGCPDTAACDSQYYGFFNQVYSAARGFKYYAKYPNSFNYIAGRNNYIQYNPNSSCGGSTVFILNQATAGLYNYTPYQPNGAALNNLYGSGDDCSAYGNRNFWRMFTDWFGSTTDSISTSYGVRLTTPITTTPSDLVAGQPVTVTYTVQNFTDQSVTYQNSILQCRFNRTTNCDTGWGGPVTLAPGQQRNFSVTFTPATGGTYTLTPYFLYNGTWFRHASSTANTITLNVPDMRITTPITVTPANPIAGEWALVRFTVQNYGSQPVNYQTSILQCRLDTTINCDSGYGGATTLYPGQQLPVEYYTPTLQSGNANLIPYYMQNGTWYKYNTANGTQNSKSLYVPDIRLTTPVAISPNNPVPGQTVTATYTVKNFGSSSVSVDSSVLQCRLNTYTNCDPTYDSPHTIAAGATRTYSVQLKFPRAGSYALKPYYSTGGNWFHYTSDPAAVLKVDVPPYVANMQLTGPISISPANPIPGQAVTVSYTVKNAGDRPAIYQTSILQCRFNTYTNCDPALDSPVNIAAGDQRTFTVNFPAARAGSYVFTPYYLQNDTWYRYGGTAPNSVRSDVPAYVANVQLVGPITTSPAQPSPGQTVNVSYTVKNAGDKPAIFQTSILQCRYNSFTNCDPSYDSPLTLAVGEQRTFTVSIPSTKASTYTFTPYFMQNDTWHRYGTDAASYLNLSVQ